jgi:F0F1-type ATP synthase assembly protein I
MSGPENKQQDEYRAAITMTVVWVAGLTLVVIFMALLAGLFLDKILDSKPLFTILLMVGSIPLTIYLTLRVVRKATNRLQPAIKKENTEEVPHRGEHN